MSFIPLFFKLKAKQKKLNIKKQFSFGDVFLSDSY